MNADADRSRTHAARPLTPAVAAAPAEPSSSAEHVSRKHAEPSTFHLPSTAPSISGSATPPTGSESPASPDKRCSPRSSTNY